MGYIITFMIGGIFGVIIMCLVTISKDGDNVGK